MKVIVTGIGKTGTTGLATMIANAFGVPYIHEPKAKQVYRKLWNCGSAVVKINIYYINDKLFDPFNKKVLLHRDPRDRFISGLLFNLISLKHKPDPDRVTRSIECLQKKESDPTSLSVRELFERLYVPYLNEFSPQQHIQLYDDMIAFSKAHPDYFSYKYESWIDGELVPLEEYLETKLEGVSAEVPTPQQKVVRTKKYGDWKNWFLPEDVEYFKPLFQKYMDHCGYHDWTLSESPVIPSQFSSEYVRKLTCA